MTRNVHICSVGTNPDPILAVTRSDIPIDAVYLVCSDDDGRLNKVVMDRLKSSEKTIRSCFASLKIEVSRLSVDPWDYQSILDRYLDIASSERKSDEKVEFHINVTSGTHIMGVAAASAAFFIGADLYYVMDETEHEVSGSPLRRFQIPSLPDVSKLKGGNKLILNNLTEDWTPNMELRDSTGYSPSKLGYHTGRLISAGLIEKKNVGKESHLRLTYSGIVAKRMMNRIE